MRLLKIQRQQLDKKLQSLKKITKDFPRDISWIKLIRNSLGMSLWQLSQRLGMSSPALKGLEKREEDGSITLNSLKKVAEELDCDLVYMFVPRRSLESYVEKYAIRKAAEVVNAISDTMNLEDQGLSSKEKELKIRELANELLRNEDKGIWKSLNIPILRS